MLALKQKAYSPVWNGSASRWGERPSRYSHARYHRATRDELALSVRVFDGNRLAFSGSTTYYLPEKDLAKYRTLWREATPVLRVRGD